MGQPILFIDLHGVLVNTPVIFDEYRRITVKDLQEQFGLDNKTATKRYDRAMELWEKEAFEYLRNPLKKKVGDEFLNFLERCDKVFPTLLYEGLDVNGKTKVRTRPYEYSIAVQIPALYPEVIRTLDRLKAQGYEMYVASSSHTSHIEGMIEANELQNYFESYFGFDTVAATKHTLRYYKTMVKMVNADPKMCVMVGNSMHEVLKPRKLGMKTIHIDRERKVPPDIRRMASKSIKNLSSLPAHLDSLQIRL